MRTGTGSQTTLDIELPARRFHELLPTAERPENPPELTLSPNPFLDDFVASQLHSDSPTEPFPDAIAAGKNTYVYDAHTYHTKVPPEGIEALIDYYAPPGGTVLDPFCGSGMTGVAALRQGRRAILSDLSPAAAFIAYNNATPVDADEYRRAIDEVLQLSAELEKQLYLVPDSMGHRELLTNFVVWSFTTVCSACSKEFVLWDAAKDERESVRESKIRTEFECPMCGVALRKRDLPKRRRVPVRVVLYDDEVVRGLVYRKPNQGDLDLIQRVEAEGVPEHLWYPRSAFPLGVNTRQPIAAGILRVDQAYTTRALWALAYLWDICSRWPETHLRLKLLYTLTSLYKRVTCFAEYRFWGGSSNTHNLNVPWVMKELNVFQALRNKASTIGLYFAEESTEEAGPVRVSAQSATDLAQLPDGSIDYVFTDPPFGGNINYSEMNFLWESWLGSRTNTSEEAIVNRHLGKGLPEYGDILRRAFVEIRRVLRKDGWMTVVFHNSSADVWQTLQEAITGGGWSITGSQVFDKKHGTFKQFVSENAVGYDLVFHCRKGESMAPSLVSESGGEMEAQVMSFVASRVGARPQDYRVEFLHVDRADEIDFRRLYSEWLSERLGVRRIGLGFEAFRALAKEAITGP